MVSDSGMTPGPGYSDKVNHAFAFAAKHHAHGLDQSRAVQAAHLAATGKPSQDGERRCMRDAGPSAPIP